MEEDEDFPFSEEIESDENKRWVVIVIVHWFTFFIGGYVLLGQKRKAIGQVLYLILLSVPFLQIAAFAIKLLAFVDCFLLAHKYRFGGAIEPEEFSFAWMRYIPFIMIGRRPVIDENEREIDEEEELEEANTPNEWKNVTMRKRRPSKRLKVTPKRTPSDMFDFVSSEGEHADQQQQEEEEEEEGEGEGEVIEIKEQKSDKVIQNLLSEKDRILEMKEEKIREMEQAMYEYKKKVLLLEKELQQAASSTRKKKKRKNRVFVSGEENDDEEEEEESEEITTRKSEEEKEEEEEEEEEEFVLEDEEEDGDADESRNSSFHYMEEKEETPTTTTPVEKVVKRSASEMFDFDDESTSEEEKDGEGPPEEVKKKKRTTSEMFDFDEDSDDTDEEEENEEEKEKEVVKRSTSEMFDFDDESDESGEEEEEEEEEGEIKKEVKKRTTSEMFEFDDDSEEEEEDEEEEEEEEEEGEDSYGERSSEEENDGEGEIEHSKAKIMEEILVEKSGFESVGVQTSSKSKKPIPEVLLSSGERTESLSTLQQMVKDEGLSYILDEDNIDLVNKINEIMLENYSRKVDEFCRREPFHLQDAFIPIQNSMKNIVEDDFSLCFQPTPYETWVTNIPYFFIYCVGVLVRFLILLPLRLLFLTISTIIMLVFVTIGLVINNMYESSMVFSYLQYLLILYGEIWVLSLGGVVKVRNRRPRRRPNQIYVCNHTTVLDIAFLLRSNMYSLIGQSNPGLLKFFQNIIMAPMENVWFERTEKHDRELVKIRLENRMKDASKPPLLVFPEGTCVNNRYTVQFKKGVFELNDVEICPIAIKYNLDWNDPFWYEDSFFMHVLRLMKGWATPCEIHFLEPQKIREGEKGHEFARRVKKMISKRIKLRDVSWNGYLRWVLSAPSERFIKANQEAIASRIQRRKMKKVDEEEDEEDDEGDNRLVITPLRERRRSSQLEVFKKRMKKGRNRSYSDSEVINKTI